MSAGSGHSIPQKSIPLVRYLQERIHTGQLAHGERIPPLRSFMEMFGLSYGTVKRGIDYLSAAGLLEKRIGSGVYVASCVPTERQTSRSISVCMSRNVAHMRRGIFPTVFSGVQEAAAQQQIALSLHHLDFRSLASGALEALAERDQGIIFLTEIDRHLDSLDCPCPCVAMCSRATFGGRISTIDMDPVQAAELASAHFLDREIRSVTIVTHVTPAYRHRGDIFARVFGAQGGRTEVRDMADARDFEAGEGLLFTTGWVAQRAAEKHADLTGRSLAQDYVVLSLDGKHTLDPAYHTLPSVVAPWALMGQMAFEDVMSRLDRPGWPTRRIYVPGVLDVRVDSRAAFQEGD